MLSVFLWNVVGYHFLLKVLFSNKLVGRAGRIVFRQFLIGREPQMQLPSGFLRKCQPFNPDQMFHILAQACLTEKQFNFGFNLKTIVFVLCLTL